MEKSKNYPITNREKVSRFTLFTVSLILSLFIIFPEQAYYLVKELMRNEVDKAYDFEQDSVQLEWLVHSLAQFDNIYQSNPDSIVLYGNRGNQPVDEALAQVIKDLNAAYQRNYTYNNYNTIQPAVLNIGTEIGLDQLVGEMFSLVEAGNTAAAMELFNNYLSGLDPETRMDFVLSEVSSLTFGGAVEEMWQTWGNNYLQAYQAMLNFDANAIQTSAGALLALMLGLMYTLYPRAVRLSSDAYSEEEIIEIQSATVRLEDKQPNAEPETGETSEGSLDSASY